MSNLVSTNCLHPTLKQKEVKGSSKLLLRANQNIINSLQEINNLAAILEELQRSDRDTLVIFDIDDVLIMPIEEDDFRHHYRLSLLNSAMTFMNKDQKVFLESIIFANTKRILVDRLILSILDYLKLNKISAIALTATGSGRFGVIPRIEHFRIKELNNVDISFANLNKLNDNYIANDLKNYYKVFPKATGLPCLKSGIIFAAGVDKGLVLEHILYKYNYFPKKIIFIDDYLYNVVSIQKLCIKLKISFYGFHYKATSLLPLPIINPQLESIRFKVLKNEHKWLNYEQLNKITLKSRYNNKE